MNIYWKLLGGHYHCRVFMNGAKCGDLCCRKEEWKEFRAAFSINEVRWQEEAEEPFAKEKKDDTEAEENLL